MRTEVKIGLVVCVVLAGFVGLYMALSGGGSTEEATPAAAAKPGTDATSAAQPTTPISEPRHSTLRSPTPPASAAQRSAGAPAKRTRLTLDLTPFDRGSKTTTAGQAGAVANRTQRVDTRAVPGLTLGNRSSGTTTRPSAADRRPALSLSASSSTETARAATPRTSLRPTTSLTLPSRSPATPRTYTVKATDSAGYWGIAKKVYGESRYAYLISKANPDVDPKRLRPGQTLKILPRPVATASGASAGASGGATTVLPSGDRRYVIASGDTYTKLATKFYGDVKYVDVIIKANPDANPDRLQIGQSLVIPRRIGAPSATLGSGSAAAAPTPGPGQKVYTIVDGDLLSKISASHYGSSGLWPVILKANPGLNPRRLVPGKKILLPSKAEAMRLAGEGATGAVASTPAASGASASTATGYVPGKPYFGDE